MMVALSSGSNANHVQDRVRPDKLASGAESIPELLSPEYGLVIVKKYRTCFTFILIARVLRDEGVGADGFRKIRTPLQIVVSSG